MTADIFAYYMRDGMIYVGKKQTNPGNEITMNDFIVIPTVKITQDKRAPEVVILEEYENRNKGRVITLSLEKGVGFSNISLALRQGETD
jgi:hypothetical protein